MNIVATVPIRIESSLNLRENWRTNARSIGVEAWWTESALESAAP